jgi:hypothetical protein
MVPGLDEAITDIESKSSCKRNRLPILIKALLEEVGMRVVEMKRSLNPMKRAIRGHKCFGDGAVLLRNT